MPPTLEITPIGTAALSLTSISTDRLSSLPSRSRRRNFERVASWPSPGGGWWVSKLAWSKMPGGVLGGGGGPSRAGVGPSGWASAFFWVGPADLALALLTACPARSRALDSQSRPHEAISRCFQAP